MKAPKPMRAEPAARPSRPSVTLTALVVAQIRRPAQITHTAVGTSMPTSARVSEIVSEMPVFATSSHPIPMLASIVM